jgi:hypothetical protein
MHLHSSLCSIQSIMARACKYCNINPQKTSFKVFLNFSEFICGDEATNGRKLEKTEILFYTFMIIF